MCPVHLSDGVIVVRRQRESDLGALAEASHDSESLRWLTDPPMDAEARRTSMRRVEEVWRSGRQKPLVIADAPTGRPLGRINLQLAERATPAIAYSVFAEARGRGVAPRAVQLVAAWAFDDLGLTELEITADIENTASIRVAEKCGFSPAGSRIESGPAGEDREMMVFIKRTEPPSRHG